MHIYLTCLQSHHDLSFSFFFAVPLKAKREPPCLTLAASLDCGYCYIGGATRLDFDFVNEGGAGRFFLLDKQAWDAG